MIFLLAFPLPIVAAGILGWRAGKTDPQSSKEFWIAAAWVVAWATALVFLWHAVWVSALIPSNWAQIAQAAGLWTLGTAVFWLPVLMIAYVVHALRLRRQ